MITNIQKTKKKSCDNIIILTQFEIAFYFGAENS